VNDENIVVEVEDEGFRVFLMSRVLIRYEFPDFGGAQVVVDLDSKNPRQGKINYIDMLDLEIYAGRHGVKYRTGELDLIGMKRIMDEVQKQKREFDLMKWASPSNESHCE
jgi:hypothetical protein